MHMKILYDKNMIEQRYGPTLHILKASIYQRVIGRTYWQHSRLQYFNISNDVTYFNHTTPRPLVLVSLSDSFTDANIRHIDVYANIAPILRIYHNNENVN